MVFFLAFFFVVVIFHTISALCSCFSLLFFTPSLCPRWCPFVSLEWHVDVAALGLHHTPYKPSTWSRGISPKPVEGWKTWPWDPLESLLSHSPNVSLKLHWLWGIRQLALGDFSLMEQVRSAFGREVMEPPSFNRVKSLICKEAACARGPLGAQKRPPLSAAAEVAFLASQAEPAVG